MRVSILSQFAGAAPVSRVLEGLLNDNSYDRFRFLVAYVRWSGLHLIDHTLQAFASRARVDGIVGIDLGGTTIEAMTYLSELPGARIRILRSGTPEVAFHPKVYIFDGEDGWVAVVGSANSTAGGLFNNAEVCVMLESEARNEDNPLEDLWVRYDTPEPPLKRDHVQLVTDDLLEEIAPLLDRYTTPPPDRARTRGSAPPPVERAEVPPSAGRPPERPSPQGPGTVETTDTTPAGGPDVLYMEIFERETGGGTQIQFPKRVISEFFGSPGASITWLMLKTPDGVETVRIQKFLNSTYRIPLRFLAEVARPAVVRVERVGDDEYDVEAKSHGTRGYTSWHRRCTDQTRAGSRKYGFE